MKTRLLIAALILLCQLGYAQYGQFICSSGWQNSFSGLIRSGDKLLDLAADSNTCVIVEQRDTALTLEWTARFCHPGLYISKVIVLNDDKYLVCGNYYDDANDKYYSYVAKMGRQGNVLFEKMYGTVDGHLNATEFSPALPGNNGFVISGGNCAYHTWAIQCDSLGNIVWQHSYETTANQFWVMGPSGIDVRSSTYLFSSNILDGQSYKTGIIAYALDAAGNCVATRQNMFSWAQYNNVGADALFRLHNGNYVYFMGWSDSIQHSGFVLLDSAFQTTSLINHVITPGKHTRLGKLQQLSNGDIVMLGSTRNSSVSLTSGDDTYALLVVFDSTLTLKKNIATQFYNQSQWLLPGTPAFANGTSPLIQLDNHDIITSFYLTGGKSGYARMNGKLQGLCMDTSIQLTLYGNTLPTTTSWNMKTLNTKITDDTITAYIGPGPSSYVSKYVCAGQIPADTVVTPVGLTEVSFSELKIMPNPTTGRVLIQNNTYIQQLKIFDAVGRTVIEYTPNNTQQQINLSTPGMYFVAITVGGKTVTRKLVVSN